MKQQLLSRCFENIGEGYIDSISYFSDDYTSSRRYEVVIKVKSGTLVLDVIPSDGQIFVRKSVIEVKFHHESSMMEFIFNITGKTPVRGQEDTYPLGEFEEFWAHSCQYSF